MSANFIRSGAFLAAAIVAGACLAGPASAQQSVMKECGSRWQAAKAANQTEGQTWQQFLAKCRAEIAAKPAPGATAAPATAAAPAAAPPSTAAPAARRAAASPAGMVFPTRVDPKYASDSPGVARRKTCLDQYNANKSANNGAGNAGKTWIQKGGGYYSECNKHLKGG
jgi:hypothetical protein